MAKAKPSQHVNEDDLKGLFKATVDNLVQCMRDGTASPKDKEIALKLISDNQIGVELGKPDHMDLLDHPLPFDEMFPQ